MSTYTWPVSGGGGGVTIYSTFSAFSPGTEAGELAVAADTGDLYEWNGSAWQLLASPSGGGPAPGASGDMIFNSSGVFAGDPDFTTNGSGTLSATNLTLTGLTASELVLTNSSKQLISSAIGNLTDVGTDGITVTNGTGSVIGSGTSLSQHVADTTHNGYLSSTDWNTFNSKQAALTLTNLTDAGTDGITITNGTGAVIGSSAVTIAQHVADTTHNGYLASADWNTFNGKGSVSSVGLSVPATSILSVTGSPVTGSGTLALATTGTSGGIPYFSSTSQLTSSALLTANQVILGGGAGSAPVSLAAGSQYQVLTMGASNPGYGAVNLAQSAAVTGTLAVSNGGTGSGSALVQYGVKYAASTTAEATTAAGTANYPLVANSASAPTFQQLSLTAGVTGVLPIANGGTNVSSVTTSPTATAFAGWDANSNLSANNFFDGWATTATAAGTTTLTITSAGQQYFTGSTTQTVKLPTTSILAGCSYTIVNNSTGVVTVQSSGANTIQAMAASTQLVVTALVNSPTTAANWNSVYSPLAQVLAGISPTVQTFTSGSGTYTKPSGVQYIRVRMVGGGGGGGGSSSSSGGTTGQNGGNTTFGSSLLTANGGQGSQGGNLTNGGGTATINAPAYGTTITGSAGNGTPAQNASAPSPGGGVGGPGPWGGGGAAGGPAQGGSNAAANSGAGGGGAGASGAGDAGGGGCSGGFIDAIIPSPSASYSYSVGAGGTGGSAGSGGSAGGAGGLGYIEVTEYYNNLAVGTTAAVTAGYFLAGPTSGSAASPSFRALQAPTQQIFTSGSGTYTAPSGVLYLKVRMVGGGGSGAGSSTISANNGGSGSAGNASTFGSSLLTANGGGAGVFGTTFGSVSVAVGGTASISSPAYGTTMQGGSSSAPIFFDTTTNTWVGLGGVGGVSFFGGNGTFSGTIMGGTGGSASANSGSGGGGGQGTVSTAAAGAIGGGGGGAGGYLEAIIPSPSSTYAYSVGASTSGGSAGTSGNTGGAGARGYIEVTEYYQ